MASGTIHGTTSNSYIDSKIEWSSVANKDGNYSTVTAKLYYKRNNTGYETSGTLKYTIRIGLAYTYSGSEYIMITEDGWTLAGQASTMVAHADDGSCSVYIGATGSISSTTLKSTSCEGTVTLDKIPRATTIDSLSCTTKYFTGGLEYKYTPKSASYYNKCDISVNLGGTYIAVRSIKLGKKSASQQHDIVVLSGDERSTIYNLFPNGTTGTLRFTFRTYFDEVYYTQIGDALYKEITLNIPNTNDTQPTATMTLSPASDLAAPLNSLYIKGKTKVAASFTNGSGKYGATIKSYTMSVLGKTYGSPYKSDYLTTDGTVTVTGTVTDSRGFSRAYTQEITVYATETTIDSLSCATSYLTGTMTYKYTPQSASNYQRCNITLNIGGTHTAVKSINLGKASASQQTATITLSESELTNIYNKLPSSAKGTLRFTMRTYADSSYSKDISLGNYKEIALSIPNDETTQPTVSSMSLSASNGLKSPYDKLFIQGYSKVKADLGFGTKFNASVVASSITVNGKVYESPYESDILTQDGKVTVKATVKDSRGFYGTNYKDIEVIPYAKPYVRSKSGESSIVVARCDQSANLTDSGTYLKIKAKVVYSKVISDGVQNNYAKIKFRYRIEGGAYSAWQTIHDCETDSNKSDEVITPPLLNGVLDTKYNYQVQIIASDDFVDSTPITFAIASDKVYMDRPAGGNSMGLGGYSSGDGNLDVYWQTMARGGLSLFDGGNEIPLDSTMPLPRDQVPDGWNPDTLANGVYAVTNSRPLKHGDTVIMYNGVLIQMAAYVGGNVKIQLALTSDETRSPYYRVNWYGNWGNWRSFKL